MWHLVPSTRFLSVMNPEPWSEVGGWESWRSCLGADPGSNCHGDLQGDLDQAKKWLSLGPERRVSR